MRVFPWAVHEYYWGRSLETIPRCLAIARGVSDEISKLGNERGKSYARVCVCLCVRADGNNVKARASLTSTVADDDDGNDDDNVDDGSGNARQSTVSLLSP